MTFLMYISDNYTNDNKALFNYDVHSESIMIMVKISMKKQLKGSKHESSHKAYFHFKMLVCNTILNSRKIGALNRKRKLEE